MTELQEIVNIINELGIEAKSAFVWWLIFRYGTWTLRYVVGASTFLIFFFTVYKTIRFCVTKFWDNQ